MRRILVSAAVLLAVGAFLVFTLGASGGSSDPTYRIELDNAFGLVNGADFKVAGVISGSIKSIGLCYTDKAAHCQNPLHALVTVQASQRGFGQFHQDAFCQSRPQSLIGEYFVEANRTSSISATQAPAIQATWQKLPAFLQQLRPALQKLGAAADAQVPVFQNLNAASSNLNTFFHDLVPFSHESIPSLKSLGS